MFLYYGIIKISNYFEEKRVRYNADKYIFENGGHLNYDNVTVDKYNRIQYGMNYNEVAYIMEGNGVLESKEGKYKVYKWDDGKGHFIIIQFENNKVDWKTRGF